MQEKVQSFEEAAAKVVKFWIDNSFGKALNQDMGIEKQYDIMNMMANFVSLQSKMETPLESIEKFSKKLYELIMEKKELNKAVILSVDYSPCEMLNNCCNFAGIDSQVLPIKSYSQINIDNSVIGKQGYSGQCRLL